MKDEEIKRAIEERDEQIKGLEHQVEALKKYIRDRFGVDVDANDEGEIINEEEVMTSKEIEQMEYHSTLLEQQSYVFNYGRGEVVAENL